MFSDKLQEIQSRIQDVETQLAKPEIIENRSKYEELTKEYSTLQKIAHLGDDYVRICRELVEQETLVKDSSHDEEMLSYITEEIETLQKQKEQLEKKIRMLLIPKEKNDDRNILVEVRAGTGGEEAALFVADLQRMYTRYAEKHGWKTETMSSNPTGLGGFKEVVFSIEGDNVYRELQFESGVHRVQRIPVTESGGRIHTSAVTVAVLPEAQEIEISIDPSELRIDVCRASGPGGQSVNTTDSAVRIMHLPTGITVRCQDEKSQHKNKAKALRILRAHIKDKKEREEQQRIAADRRSQVGSGDRSERIRTYNFPQNRVTDHRVNLTIYNLEGILNGEIENIIETLLLSSYDKHLQSTPEKKE